MLCQPHIECIEIILRGSGKLHFFLRSFDGFLVVSGILVAMSEPLKLILLAVVVFTVLRY